MYLFNSIFLPMNMCHDTLNPNSLLDTRTVIVSIRCSEIKQAIQSCFAVFRERLEIFYTFFHFDLLLLLMLLLFNLIWPTFITAFRMHDLFGIYVCRFTISSKPLFSRYE